MEKDKGAIIVGKPDQLIPTIETVIASVNAGLDRSQLDRQLTLHEPINRKPSRTFAPVCSRVYNQNRLAGVASPGDGQGAMGAVGL